MKNARPNATTLLLAVAVCSIAAGVGSMAHSLLHAHAVPSRFRAIRRSYERILDARADHAAHQARLSAFDAGPDRPQTPASLHPQFLRVAPQLVQRVPVANTPVGRLIREEWLADHAPPDAVLRFAAACEAAHPPWRVESLRLTAVPGEDGRVRAGLVLLGIEGE